MKTKKNKSRIVKIVNTKVVKKTSLLGLPEKDLLDLEFSKIQEMLADPRLPESAKKLLIKQHSKKLIKLYDRIRLQGTTHAG